MLRLLFGLFIVLHGLVHLWYFVLSHRLIEIKPDMGWSGRSWIFTGFLGDSTTRLLASVLFVLAAATFVISGIGILARTDWWRAAMIGAAVISSAIILLFWDGGFQQIVEKGLVGLLISIGILVALLLVKWPSAAF